MHAIDEEIAATKEKLAGIGPTGDGINWRKVALEIFLAILEALRKQMPM